MVAVAVVVDVNVVAVVVNGGVVVDTVFVVRVVVVAGPFFKNIYIYIYINMADVIRHHNCRNRVVCKHVSIKA